MDRFEAFNAVPTLLILAIYIPVWIDLKESSYTEATQKRTHLHSSMDRFEVRQKIFQLTACADLHSSMDRFEGCSLSGNCKTEHIYIPVWIDLKDFADVVN